MAVLDLRQESTGTVCAFWDKSDRWVQNQFNTFWQNRIFLNSINWIFPEKVGNIFSQNFNFFRFSKIQSHGVGNGSIQ